MEASSAWTNFSEADSNHKLQCYKIGEFSIDLDTQITLLANLHTNPEINVLRQSKKPTVVGFL
ncbi:hypothetical protein D7D54_08675 [Streptococcus chosunense]|uniref:Uncharacterized protein n=2 Tax=Streptococcus mitis group TaxID=3409772 RepID=A0A3B0BH76_9STRE|nr:hypothetical protein M059_08635 [Streptococcus mitis 18/56]RKN71367.1 hypothetical protein D7D54_08675 [Streptococcus chosunense]